MPSTLLKLKPSQCEDITMISAAFNTFGISVRNPRNLTLFNTPNDSANCFTASCRTPTPANHTSNFSLSKRFNALTIVSWSFASLNPATINIAIRLSFNETSSTHGSAQLIPKTSTPLFIVDICL